MNEADAAAVLRRVGESLKTSLTDAHFALLVLPDDAEDELAVLCVTNCCLQCLARRMMALGLRMLTNDDPACGHGDDVGPLQ